MQKRLEENTSNKYIVGDKMTIADFDNAHISHDHILNDVNPLKG
jgi:hypothetical protein